MGYDRELKPLQVDQCQRDQDTHLHQPPHLAQFHIHVGKGYVLWHLDVDGLDQGS